MSDKSEEELVGDVDFYFDFDPVENTSTVSQHKRQGETNSGSSSKLQPVRKKKVAKPAVIQDDLLQAFAIGAISIKKMSKPVSKVKKNIGVQGKVHKLAATAQQANQRGIAQTQIKGKEVEKTQVKEVLTKEKTNNKEEKGIAKTQVKEKEVDKSQVKKKTNDKEETEIAKIQVKGKEVDKSQEKEKTNDKEETEIAKIQVKGKEVEKEKTNDKEKTEITKIQVKGKEVDKAQVKEKINNKEVVVEKTQCIKEIVTSQKDTREDSPQSNEFMKKQCNEQRKSLRTPTGNIKSDLDHRSHKNFVKGQSSLCDSSSKLSAPKTENGRNPSTKSTNNDNQKAVKLDKHSYAERKDPDVSLIKTVKSKLQKDLKRKADEDISDIGYSAKSQKTDMSSQGEGNHAVKKDEIRFTDDDYRSMDNFLADQLLNRSREKIFSRNGVKYTVQVSPLEIADLAHPSLQQLIGLHPTISMTFKRQTVKFRKKKGYAEAAFSTMTELKEFVYQLTQIQVVEKRIDVTISAQNQSDKLSFVIHLNRNGKLLNLLDTGEDPLINRPIPIGENPGRIQFAMVPSSVNEAFMHSMFPFTNNVIIARKQAKKDGKTVYHGPVSVFYINDKWLDAVMDCCCDFSVNSFPLTVIGDYSSEERLKKMKSVEKSGTTTESSQRTRSFSNTGEYDDDDDPVSNMTRDVCADMFESIQKLRDLEPNNPNMKRLVEMQNNLSALQSSLGRSQGSEQEIFFSKEMTSNPAEKKNRELKSLEEKFEEAERVELQKEEQIKQQRELEFQKRKEFEQKKKSQWAKNILSDFKKQDGAAVEKMSACAKRILQQREQRIKEREEEEEKRRMEEETRKQEVEKLRVQREREEKLREAERNRLIERIEETRLRDSQKFSSSQLQWNPSSSSYDAPSPKAGYNRDGDQHYKKGQKSKDDGGMFASSSSMIDDNVDDRLADFARELMEEGKIEKKTLPFSPSSKSTERHYSSEREGQQDDLIISEEEYQEIVANGRIYTITENHLKVRITNSTNRLCPVQNCPSKTNFRNMELFMDHWIIFHKAQTTMRFCPMCSAYFMNPEELENHMMKHHLRSSKEAIELVRNARKKVIPNPSYRDPFPFIAPLPIT